MVIFSTSNWRDGGLSSHWLINHYLRWVFKVLNYFHCLILIVLLVHSRLRDSRLIYHFLKIQHSHRFTPTHWSYLKLLAMSPQITYWMTGSRSLTGHRVFKSHMFDRIFICISSYSPLRLLIFPLSTWW